MVRAAQRSGSLLRHPRERQRLSEGWAPALPADGAAERTSARAELALFRSGRLAGQIYSHPRSEIYLEQVQLAVFTVLELIVPQS